VQSEGQDAAATAIAAKVPEDTGTVEAGSKPLSRPSEANLAELAKRKEAARRKEEAGAAREGQLTAKERRATGRIFHHNSVSPHIAFGQRQSRRTHVAA
jgi:hypothetical protein